MIKFLHLGDVHLGYRQYKLLEREKDYFKALDAVCCKYAIDEQVDFVLIAGDLFNYRSIAPQTYNEAVHVFNKLKQAHIPVLAIEGNHDFKESGNYNNLRGSWFEALAQNQLIYFLYHKNNQPDLKPLEYGKKFLGGAYLDLPCKGKTIRVVGSSWQGFNAGASLSTYAEAIQRLTPKADFTIFMFHAGHENYLAVNRGGVSSNDFFHLQGIVDYIALGHIHEHYIIQDKQNTDFIFNPGSTEVNSMAEVNTPRGGLLVQVNDEMKVNHRLVQDYYQRPFHQLPAFCINDFPSTDELFHSMKQAAQEQLSQTDTNNTNPVIQLSITGYGSYENIAEGLRQLKDNVEAMGALYCSVKWDVQPDKTSYNADNHNLPLKRVDQERNLLKAILSVDESADENEVQELTELMLRVKEIVIKQEGQNEEILHEIADSFPYPLAL